MGFWLVVSGISQLGYGITGAYHKAWRVLLGVLDIALGAYLVFSGPVSGLVFVAAIVGFSFLFRGLFLTTLAFALRRQPAA